MITEPAFADRNLQELVGKWVGTGRITTDPDTQTKRSRCHVVVQSEIVENSVLLDGRCSVAEGVGRIRARLVDDGGGNVRAGFTSSISPEATQLRGVIEVDGINLASQNGFSWDGAIYSVRVRIEFQDDDNFEIKEWNALEGTVDWKLVTDLQFTKSGED